MRGYQAQARFEQGAWEEAVEEATQVLHQYHSSADWDFSMLLMLAWVRLRRGDPGSASMLEEARRLALTTGESRQIAPVAAARAEAAWLQGDLESCRAEAREGYDLALAHPNPWLLGELSGWLWRAGSRISIPEPIAAPYERQLAGEWQGSVGGAGLPI